MKKTFLKLTALAASAFVLAACNEKNSGENVEQAKPKVVFLAGATGVIGEPLSKALVEKGYKVYGTTRSEIKAKALEEIGVIPIVVDVFNAPVLEQAVVEAKPDVVINQLSSLPKGLKDEEMEEGLKRDSKIRIEGTKNLVAAAEKAGAKKYIAQSFMYYAPSDHPVTEEGEWYDENDATYGESIKSIKSLETQTLAGKFTPVVLRYGWIYGGKSGFDAAPEGYAGIHINALVDATVRAVEANLNGVYNVAEDGPIVDSNKFKNAVPEWNAK
ncbi:NAD-dependent epimerase/dehydratase family protein [Rodentibacter trehalosifermentans]|nr:NAD(P)-dependent oxidoreductase [Rodentibacter trehalosifermentans]